ncbi:MAG: bifunctional chorismate mutase/prephenate dehydratase, partial [Clostridiales bacterium]|nr:bifunctional chorismate mutase/prephenate dehydratase [Clostridiales bacterium]
IIPVEHTLLALPEAEISDISYVYSHPQALMQCGEYLYAHPDWSKISMKNTAMAAMKVKEDGDIHQAAIASAISADLYGLKILEHTIQDIKDNSTRFIIVCGQKVYYEDSNHISLCFEIAHRSGSLYHTLSHFIYNGLNMINIQSRPIKGRNWEYRFFVDLEGKLDDTAVHNALRGLSEETVSLRVLGTY